MVLVIKVAPNSGGWQLVFELIDGLGHSQLQQVVTHVHGQPSPQHRSDDSGLCSGGGVAILQWMPTTQNTDTGQNNSGGIRPVRRIAQDDGIPELTISQQLFIVTSNVLTRILHTENQSHHVHTPVTTPIVNTPPLPHISVPPSTLPS